MSSAVIKMASPVGEKCDPTVPALGDLARQGNPSATDVEKGSTSNVTQNVVDVDSTDTGNDTDSAGGQDRWNGSRNNTARFLVVNLALFIMGMNDACLGVGESIHCLCDTIKYVSSD